MSETQPANARPEFAGPRVRRRDGGRAGAAAGWGAIGATLALIALTVAGRKVRAPPAVVAAAVAFLPYLFAATMAAVFGLWALVPDRKTPPIALLALLGCSAVVWGPSWSARGVAAEGETVRVMSWNVRRLWGGLDDGGNPAACVVDAVRQTQPDVLTLLEVSAQDVARLEADLDMRCSHHGYLSGSGPTHGGLAACVRGEWALRSGAGQRFVDNEDWYYVFAEIEQRGRVFNLLAVHLYPYQIAKAEADPRALQELGRSGRAIVRGQSDQSAALLHRVARLEDPTVIAGDFNSTRDAALHSTLRGHLTDAWEQGGRGFGGTVRVFGRLPLRIDFVYASPAFTVSGADVPDFGCSDHRPVVADLVLTR